MSRLNRLFSNEMLLKLTLMLAATAVLAVGGSLLLSSGGLESLVFAQSKGLEGPDIDALATQNRAFERIAEAVTPAIVNIQTTQVIKNQESPFFNDPFFRQFFGNAFGQPNIPREHREHALGSGVIVSPDGYVVTNNHVIAKATDIQVMLADKRVFKGKVLGADPQTDVAVVKIEGKNLPVASWGDSSTLRVGDNVLAFGNPFGLNFTVTRGIVSAIGRSGLGIEDFEDFIQTDAAINPGNSGGALVDVQGRVVGINTAILSTNAGMGGEAGFNGVGLAIPEKTARHVLESLIRTGKVDRGFLGVTVSSLNEQLARQFQAPDISGALIQDVTSGSPGDKAGLKQGDVIRTIDGKKVDSSGQLTSTVVGMSPGTQIGLGVLRDGREIEVRVTLGSRPAELAARAAVGKAPSEGTLRGITVQSLTPAILKQLGLPEDARGVVISDLTSSSPAAQEGLQQGDVIESINRQPVDNVADFDRLAAQAKGDVLLRISRQGNGLFVAISPLSGD
jgi:serine protease Do